MPPALDIDRLVVSDEEAAAASMAGRYSWAPRGERCGVAILQGHDKTTTAIAALRTSWLCTTSLLDGFTNGTRFRSSVSGTPISVLHKLSAYKVLGVQDATEALGPNCSTFRATALNLSQSSKPLPS